MSALGWVSLRWLSVLHLSLAPGGHPRQVLMGMTEVQEDKKNFERSLGPRLGTQCYHFNLCYWPRQITWSDSKLRGVGIYSVHPNSTLMVWILQVGVKYWIQK